MPPRHKPRPTNASSRNQSAELRARLRAAGLRATAPRVAVLRLLEESGAPLSHAEVVAALGEDEWDRATLYRNLIDLSEVGLLHRSTVGQVWRFEASSPEGGAPDHPHFVCTECGKIACVASVELTVHRSRDTPRSVRRHEVEIQLSGRCDDCE